MDSYSDMKGESLVRLVFPNEVHIFFKRSTAVFMFS